MVNYGVNNLYLRPSANGVGANITANSTANQQFVETAFVVDKANTTAYLVQILGDDALVTFDGTTPAANSAFFLGKTTTYTWATGTLFNAKFLANSGTAVVYATPVSV